MAEPLTGPSTEVWYTGHGAGMDVDGFLPPTADVPDPLAAYPAGRPAGYVDESAFAGVRNVASVSDPSKTGQTYCINLRVLTAVGTGYASGTWTESNVPNLGHVTYVLHNYYPAANAPAGLTPDEQAAAVQSAVWYFTDGFVLGTTPAKVREATAEIVADAQANGPVTEPPAPDVEIAPASVSSPEGSAAGPYVVTAEGGAAVTVSVPAGYTMYENAAATAPLANPSTVASGTSVWVTGPGVTGIETVLTARATVTVQEGTVYLYDGNSPGRDDAQRLILGKTTQLEALATATAEFFTAGELTVNKAYAGGAVGQQGAAQLVIDCGEGYTFTQDIPAGTSTTQTYTFRGIPVGNTCTVTEPTTGATTDVGVTTDAPQTGTMTDEGLALTVTNTVELNPGSLNLVKVIAGGAAGSQDEISVRVMCVSGLDETFVIPAGAAAGEYTQAYTGLPAGDECTVTELATGSNAVVEVTTDAPVTVEIAPGAAVEARLTNTVELRPGSLALTKTVTGDAAGSQSDIQVGVMCDSGLDETFTIPAGAAAGDYTQMYEQIPAGSECVVTELASGANTEVEVVPGDPVTVTIEPGATAEVGLTNTVNFRPGSLHVVKVINGTGAGQQSAISLSVMCTNGLAETVDIPAGAAAGEYTQTFGGLPAGTECTVTEPRTGANSSVRVVADDPVTVTIAAGTTTDATLTNAVLRSQSVAAGGLAMSGADAPMPLLAVAAGVIGLGALLMVAVRANRRNAE
ncbi:thioester domain-containing protein [Microbacterium sp. zg.Y625]|uniref:thioester domain-containing protein n=1 Tax=Microbacterium jiangjiandongii TaxID=3049071 RepID=UPI00214CBDD0|nr:MULTISPECIES: thioester domain-containing protein [unclassified Microbacterium]MCR2791829.1 thioester domain-containing protein [Microbacterium sp. zg.Y625]WIM24646.1 thioester domain-containing protein [Microbacterium sp. zg-Y625]